MSDSGQDLYNAIDKTTQELIEAVGVMKDKGRKLARAEMDYKIALRTEILRLRLEDEVAWTACIDLAYGQEKTKAGKPGVAMLRFLRDCYQSDYETIREKINVLKLNQRTLMERAKLDLQNDTN